MLRSIPRIYTFNLQLCGFLLCLFCLPAGLTGCSSYRDLPPRTRLDINSPVLERDEISAGALIDQPAPPADYLVGPGDILSIQVYGQPDMGSAGSSSLRGSRVDGQGYLHLPLAGAIQVAGLNLKQVEDQLAKELSHYLGNPLVVAEIVDYRSQPLHLLGQFNAPGVHYMERPLTLMEGLALGNGLNEIANLRGARLIRDQQTLPVDLLGLLQNGETKNNVWLQPGDTI
ncbi:MAG: sugar transporter, partial [Desulfuromonas sp.]